MIVIVIATALLLVVCFDAFLCVSFYFETNRAAPGAVRTGERPRALAPDQVSFRHALLFLVQKANYYWQLVTAVALLARLYARPKHTTDRDVALLIINTSLATWVSAQELDGGAVAVTLAMNGFAFPLFPGRYDCRILVECELRPEGRSAPSPGHGVGDVDARTMRFEIDGVRIDSREEQLSILAMMVSSVAHPVIHSFNNRLYASHDDPRLGGFDDLFLHGQYLNAVAWFFPGLLFRIGGEGHHWYRRVLAHNAELPVPAHDHATMGALLPYSRSVRFLLRARGVLARLRREHALPVDGESLFICTVMHAIDHASCDRHTRGHVLQNQKLPNRGLFNLIALLFYRPAQHFCTNLLKDKRRKHALYRDLYDQLHAVDPELAAEVTLSISY